MMISGSATAPTIHNHSLNLSSTSHRCAAQRRYIIHTTSTCIQWVWACQVSDTCSLSGSIWTAFADLGPGPD